MDEINLKLLSSRVNLTLLDSYGRAFISKCREPNVIYYYIYENLVSIDKKILFVPFKFKGYDVEYVEYINLINKSKKL